MATVIDLDLFVEYGLVDLQPRSWPAPARDLRAARGGQANGICGAAYPGRLSLLTGLHTGHVPFSVQVTESAPDLAEQWEDVVEVSFAAEQREYGLATFDTWIPLELPAATWYRVRYCALGMDAAHDQNTRLDEHSVTDRYLLALWPAPPAAELIVREGSKFAAYWRGVARSASPPPPLPTLEQVAAAQAAERAQERERQAREWDRRLWGHPEPSPTLRAVGAEAAALARSDRVLAEQVAALDPDTLRRIAVWVARAACRRAGPARLDWNHALDALAEGRELPPPFDDPRVAWSVVSGSAPRAVVTTHPAGSPPPPSGKINPSAPALAAILAAAHADPAIAAFSALRQAIHSFDDPADLYTDLRREFISG